MLIGCVGFDIVGTAVSKDESSNDIAMIRGRNYACQPNILLKHGKKVLPTDVHFRRQDL